MKLIGQMPLKHNQKFAQNLGYYSSLIMPKKEGEVMFAPDNNPKEATLDKYVRHLSAGEYLYKAGDQGNTMHIIMSGSLQVFDSDKMIGILRAGQMLGEKAIIKNGPYRRPCTIRAAESTELLEVEHSNFKVLQTLIPDLTLRILRMLSARLDSLYELSKVLRPTHAIERVVGCLIYFTKDEAVCKHSSQGKELTIRVADISEITGVSVDIIEECLTHLSEKRIVVKGKSSYMLVDENALLQSVETLKQVIAL
ncbi:MAG: Crp/Fnr family transcriptional regulator [Deltaproteobacteria bacterium]|nr:Crp/Fnr family transcriptional regulator [Deltaproteobacteria bacterium]